MKYIPTFLFALLLALPAFAADVWWTNAPSSGYQSGDTIHLVGTFTSTLSLTNNNVTVKFESGASFTAPYWNPAAIVVGSHTNILIDGGVNGLIIATANGTSLAYTNTSRGVYIGALSGPNNPFNVTVQNLTISNMYVRTPGCTEPSPGDQNNATTQGIQVYGSQISVVNCLVDGAEVGINVGSWGNSYTTNYGINIVGNQLYRNCICLALGGGGNFTNCCLQNVNLVSNRLDHLSAWCNPATSSDLHLDGMYLFLNSGLGADTGTCIISNVVVSHNWFGPDVFAKTVTTNLVINVLTNQPADGDTLTLTVEGTAKAFRFKNSPTLSTDVQIGASPSLTADNLKAVLKTFYDYLPQRGNNAVVNFTWKVTDSSDAYSQSGTGLQLYDSGPIYPNNTTATLFMTWYSSDPNLPVAFDFKVFNNIFVWTNTSDVQTPWADGFISCNAWGNSIIANNTVLSTAFYHNTGYTYGQGTVMGSANTPLQILNNFSLDCASQYNYDRNTLLTNFNPGIFFDYNAYGRPISDYVQNNYDFYGPPSWVYYNTNTLVIGFQSNVTYTNAGGFFTNVNTGQNCYQTGGIWYLNGKLIRQTPLA